MAAPSSLPHQAEGMQDPDERVARRCVAPRSTRVSRSAEPSMPSATANVDASSLIEAGVDASPPGR